MASTHQAPESGIYDLIASELPRLSSSLARVGKAVLEEGDGITDLSANQLAERSNASQASVTRFCQALGLASYQDLLLAIARENGRFTASGWTTSEVDIDITPNDSLQHVVQAVVSADIRGLEQTAQRMDLDAIERAAVAIGKARVVDVYGVGGSGAVADETQTRLFAIGFPVRSWTEVHAAVTSAALLRPGDVAIGISDSGVTRETIEPLEQAKERGATTIAITRDRRSLIGKLADIQLSASGMDTRFRVGAIASRHSQLLLIDVLYMRVAQLNYERAAASIALTSHIAPSHRLPQNGKRRRPRG